MSSYEAQHGRRDFSGMNRRVLLTMCMIEKFTTQTFPLFSALSEAHREELLEGAEVRSYQPGDFVVRQGDKADAVYVLLEGAFQVVTTNRFFVNGILYIYTPPGIVGEVGVLTNGMSVISLPVILPSEVLIIPRETFENLLDEIPGFAKALLRDVCYRIQNSYQVHIVGTVEARLAALLLSYAKAIGVEMPNGVEVPRKAMIYRQLAHCISATERSVQRAFDAWRDHNVLTRTVEGWLLNCAELEKISGPGRAQYHHNLRVSLPRTQ